MFGVDAIPSFCAGHFSMPALPFRVRQDAPGSGIGDQTQDEYGDSDRDDGEGGWRFHCRHRFGGRRGRHCRHGSGDRGDQSGQTPLTESLLLLPTVAPTSSLTLPSSVSEGIGQLVSTQAVLPPSTPSSSSSDLSIGATGSAQTAKPQKNFSVKHSDTTAIAVGAVGGFFLLVLIAGAILFCIRRRRNRTAPSAEFLSVHPPGRFQRMSEFSSLSHNADGSPVVFTPGSYPYPIREKE
jgi:hypothetical protein